MILVVTGLDALALQRGHVQRILEAGLVGCGANPLLLGNGVGIALTVLDMVAQDARGADQRLARPSFGQRHHQRIAILIPILAPVLGLLDEGFAVFVVFVVVVVVLWHRGPPRERPARGVRASRIR